MRKMSDEVFLNKLKEEFDIVLNSGQEKTVLMIDGAILVVAVPGAGKTFSICVRLYNMILNHNIDPSRILVATFSKESAKDMTNKFKNMFESKLIEEVDGYLDNQVNFSTIHSFAYKIIRDYSSRNNIYYKIIDNKKRETFNKIYKDICEENITDDIYESITSAISYFKNKLVSLEDVKENSYEIHYKFFEIFSEYENFKKENDYIDYDDMLCMALDILKTNAYFREKYTDMFEYILLDEAQDTSNVQFEIMKILSEKYNNICCVGDDDQSIYEWRSAEVDNFLYFDRYFPNTIKIFMEQNYRSTQKIIETSNLFIKSNEKRYNKDMFTQNDIGDNINIVECKSYNSQIEFIINSIKNKKNLKDVAIIFRNNISAFTIANVFIKENIPFYIKGYKESFFNHWVLQDILAFLNFALYPKDYSSFERIAFRMNRYISGNMLKYIRTISGDNTVFEKLLQIPELKTFQKDTILTLRQEFTRLKNKHTKYAIDYICDELGYFKYLEKTATSLGLSIDSLKETIFIIKEIASDCESVYDFENYIYEFQEELEKAIGNYGRNVVTLTTAHSSKGLEWNDVYMVDLNEGVFPSFKAINAAKEGDYTLLESERRLYYVGMTRAKNNLYLVHTTSRNGHNILPSLFTKEVFNCSQKNINTKTFSMVKEMDSVMLFDMEPERIEHLSSLSLKSYQSNLLQVSFLDKKEKRNKNIKKESKKEINEDIKYKIGERIVHKAFGEGEIKKNNLPFLEILFNQSEMKKINVDFCEQNNLIKVI